MFEENIEIIKNTFSDCKGSGMYFALFFVCVLYIIIKEKNKNIKALLGYFSVAILLIILNPAFDKLIDKLINKNVYFRLFWLLPMGVSMAYVAVDIIQSLNEKSKKILTFFAIIFIIIVSGKWIYTEENYVKVHNMYKIPDQAKWIIDIISVDEATYKKVMLPESLVPYIRQVNADIELAYPRMPYGYASYQLLTELHNGNVEYVTKSSEAKGCNYIIFENNVPLSVEITDLGYKLIGQTYSYNVYKLEK